MTTTQLATVPRRRTKVATVSAERQHRRQLLSQCVTKMCVLQASFMVERDCGQQCDMTTAQLEVLVRALSGLNDIAYGQTAP